MSAANATSPAPPVQSPDYERLQSLLERIYATIPRPREPHATGGTESTWTPASAAAHDLSTPY